MGRLRVLTWHIHGSYLASLGRVDAEFLVPVRPGRPARYGGVAAGAWPGWFIEVPAEAVPELDVDVVLHQAAANWTEDRFTLLSDRQRAVPQVYVEHDPPRQHPTDTVHPVDDPDATVVHVTAFNALMWDTRRTPVRVIEHGVEVPAGMRWTGDVPRGLVVVNELARRGRRLGADLVTGIANRIPLDLAGMAAHELDGAAARLRSLGEVERVHLPAVIASHRFVFHPARYTSFGMSVCEAMLLGAPVVALATTEMPTVVRDGINGIASTDPAHLEAGMRALLEDAGLARRLGDAGRETARERFSIDRFAREWEAVLREAVERGRRGGSSDVAVPVARPSSANAPLVEVAR